MGSRSGQHIPEVFLDSKTSHMKVTKFFNLFNETTILTTLPNLFDLRGFMKDQKMIANLQGLEVIDGTLKV